MTREARYTLLAWGLGALAIFAISQFLFQVTIPAGASRGREQEARDLALIVFITAGLVAFANIGYWTYRLVKAPPPVSVKAQSSSLIWPLIGLSVFGLLRLAGGVFVLLLLYGVAVLIFRHAFGVELPNPFSH